jgi:hypothetical protein
LTCINPRRPPLLHDDFAISRIVAKAAIRLRGNASFVMPRQPRI